MSIKEGEVFVAGLTTANARDLIARAKAKDIDPRSIRVDSDGGFIVPAELMAADETPKPTRARRKTPTKSAKGKE
jgi:hypothetical protein